MALARSLGTSPGMRILFFLRNVSKTSAMIEAGILGKPVHTRRARAKTPAARRSDA